MSARPTVSRNYTQRFWEFFIFGLVFVALFLFWLIIRAGLVIGYLTGVLAGICFTAAWFHWPWRARTANVAEIPIVVATEPAKAVEATPEVVPVQQAAQSEPVIPQTVTPVKEEVSTGSAGEPSGEKTDSEAAVGLPAIVLHDLDADKELEIEAYCIKCRHRRMMHNPTLVKMKNGHHALRGVCTVCGTGMFRIVSHKQEVEWAPQQHLE